jgi:hypothetical protein
VRVQDIQRKNGCLRRDIAKNHGLGGSAAPTGQLTERGCRLPTPGCPRDNVESPGNDSSD